MCTSDDQDCISIEFYDSASNCLTPDNPQSVPVLADGKCHSVGGYSFRLQCGEDGKFTGKYDCASACTDCKIKPLDAGKCLVSKPYGLDSSNTDIIFKGKCEAPPDHTPTIAILITTPVILILIVSTALLIGFILCSYTRDDELEEAPTSRSTVAGEEVEEIENSG